MKKNILYIFIVALSLSFYGCKLDMVNANAPSDEEILNSREGLMVSAIGMKQFYATSGVDALAVLTTAPTTREAKGVATFTNVLEMEAGGTALPTFNGNVLALWSRMLRVMTMADDLIEKIPVVLKSDDPLKPGLTATANLFKAMAITGLATGFEQFPVQTTKAMRDASFVNRQQGMEKAITILNDAVTLLNGYTAPTDLTGRVLGADFSLINVIHAYRARLNMMAGKYGDALAAAALASQTVKSQFVYDGSRTANPLFTQMGIGQTRSFLPRNNFGLPAAFAEANDKRLDFYYQGAPFASASDQLKNILGFGAANNTPIPIYLPDEMKLIKAEALLRTGGSVTDALAEINAVRTQTAGDIFGVNAALPAYSGATTVDALLLEVYIQRCKELYLSGLKLEDSRRFARPAPPTDMTERTRNFYPYPDQERDNNPNTPANPAI